MVYTLSIDNYLKEVVDHATNILRSPQEQITGQTTRTTLNLLDAHLSSRTQPELNYPSLDKLIENLQLYVSSIKLNLFELERQRDITSISNIYGEISDITQRIIDGVRFYRAGVEDTLTTTTYQRFSDEWYTKDQVAKLMKVDPKTVQRWISSGNLKVVRKGKKVLRINKNDLDRFLATYYSKVDR